MQMIRHHHKSMKVVKSSVSAFQNLINNQLSEGMVNE